MRNHDGKVLESYENLSVRYLDEDDWYWYTEEENEDGYAVFEDNNIIFKSCDEYEARVHFECLLHGYSQYSDEKPPKLLFTVKGRLEA